MNVLVWFRRDLRAFDHPALAAAGAMGPVLPVFVIEPDFWTQADRSGRQWAFLRETLLDLRGQLRGQLLVRQGAAVTVLAGLCRKHRIRRIVTMADAAWPGGCDVAEWARGAGVEWLELPQGADAGQGALNFVADLAPGPIPDARSLGMVDDRCPHRQAGGRAAGQALLDGFLTHRSQGYQQAETHALLSERASSRLSPHLAWGSLSAREVALAAAERQVAANHGDWAAGLRLFQSRLALRDQSPVVPMTGQGAAHDLDAFAAGETGLPFVDAVLRYFQATGWLNHRLRALLVSIALHHLRINPTLAGQALARLSTDYDPTIHSREMQRVALARPLHPLPLAARLDPTGSFTRRWLPELAHLPDDALQQPWKSPLARPLLGRRYPEPLVDPNQALRRAGARKGATHRRPDFTLIECPRQLALPL
ncbi:FAD-binding domain-containing protein [Neogemmobacter tilapiae]|uniref:Deoxyribodipyrimidine photo-lyase n=1 Tax=Neogemmobacter tilapiae TaxID=875041 RepID=A0A918TV63_9RHOB|nr:FAD-binding domain-containing protein [Gemmobacter tilapiae]GHC62839.1 deoxyribodipyrimidine photo-lyase [Gemmobacter tilapiae]